MKKRKICVVTGSRAEYGLLQPLMKCIQEDKALHLQIIATGMHLSPEFGLTYQEIEKEYKINEKIEILLSSDSSIGIAKSMGLALTGLAEAYMRLSPDLIVVLGDRFEIFSAASAALVSKIPVAHLHGGEITEGAFDDSFRHCITKMSHLHFTATEEYRKRVIQLGEDPRHVFNVGALGLDNIRIIKFLSKKELEKQCGFQFHKHNLLVTFHPVTLENNIEVKHFKNLLNILKTLKNICIIFTKTNADTNGRKINKMIDEFVTQHPENTKAFMSMGQLRYLSAMQYVDAVVGNSSSGIIEAPSFKIGTINIGDRQKGRIKAESVIDCSSDSKSIHHALKKLYSSKFQDQLKKVKNPYGDGRSAPRIIKILKKVNINNIIKKEFFNLKFKY